MGKLLSELCEGSPMNPWRESMPPRERAESYRQLVRKLGTRYAKCEFANYRVYEENVGEKIRPSQRYVFSEVCQFAEQMPDRLAEGGGLVLFGRPGTGKDHLLVACMYWAILRHGWRVNWVDGLNLYQEARDLIGSESSERDMIAKYTIPQILAVSDPIPPKGEASAYATDVVLRIVDRRYRDLKSTWATFNVHDGGEAESRLASPIIDRLRHNSLCLECNWPSFRARRT
jgi:DNA replication protein DnaC